MMRLSDIMTSPVETIETAEPARAAKDRMQAAGFHHLVAVERGRPAGMVSLRDLTLRDVGDRIVAEVMNPDLAVAKPDDTVREAANRLRGRHAGALAIVSHGKVLGILTITDLLELIGRGVSAPIEHRERRSKLMTARTRRPLMPRKIRTGYRSGTPR